jgi:integrase
MRWEDLDLEHGLWRIPDTKAGTPVVVPLAAPAVEILLARQEETNESPWVFPSRGKTGHLTEPKSAWKRILERAGLEDVRIHDLRRTLGSWQAITGSTLPIIGKSLGHTQPATTMIYSRLTVTPVRESVDRAASAILAIAENKKPNREPLAIDIDTTDEGEAETQAE